MSTATLDEPLGVLARRDLTVQPQFFRGRRLWCVKDPVSLAYFHMRDEEYEILRSLDSRTSMARVLGTFQSRFPGQSIDAGQVQQFLAGLYRNGLITIERPGQGRTLWSRRERTRRRSWLAALPGILAIRFRGIDPTPLLRAIYDVAWWMFSPGALGLAAVAIIAAAATVLARFDRLIDALPDAAGFFTAGDIALFFVAMGLIKVLHEVGHGLTCLRLGGECHEMGVMLLVFAPCLYCDVSDSWLFESKWRRVAVAAAGIGVELFLAALATFGWAFSEPGLFHVFCMQVMVICSVNTLLFNGNPLLRYDGYFVLSDLIEVPNLSAEGRGAVTRLIFGRDTFDPPIGRHEALLVSYGLASSIYRVFVTAAIIWLCLKLLTPWGLGPFAYLLGAMCVLGLVAGPAASLAGSVIGPRPRRVRGLVTLVILAGAASVLLFVPLPFRIDGAAVLQPEGATPVYLPIGGAVVEAIEAGNTVDRGQVLGRLTDAALERDVVVLESRVAELRAQIEVLGSHRLADPTLAAQLPATVAAATAAERQLAQRRKDAADLTIRSPRPGMVLPPPTKIVPASDDHLMAWEGSPLEPENRGSFLEPGTLLCLVGDPHRIEAVVFIDEAFVAFVRPGQAVRLMFDQTAGTSIQGRVQEVANDPLASVPAELAVGSLVASRRSDDGVLRPTQTTYEVKVRLDGVDGSALRIRGVGQARIEAGTDRIYDRLYRFLRRTFRFEL